MQDSSVDIFHVVSRGFDVRFDSLTRSDWLSREQDALLRAVLGTAGFVQTARSDLALNAIANAIPPWPQTPIYLPGCADFLTKLPYLDAGTIVITSDAGRLRWQYTGFGRYDANFEPCQIPASRAVPVPPSIDGIMCIYDSALTSISVPRVSFDAGVVIDDRFLVITHIQPTLTIDTTRLLRHQLDRILDWQRGRISVAVNWTVSSFQLFASQCRFKSMTTLSIAGPPDAELAIRLPPVRDDD